MSGLYADIAANLHERVKAVPSANAAVVERALKAYLTDQWPAEAEVEAQVAERRAEILDAEAEELRELAKEREKEAAEKRAEAEELREHADDVSDFVDASDARTLGDHVDDIKELLRDNPEAVVWPEHGMVEDAVLETGASVSDVFRALEQRGVDASRLRDEPLGGGV